MLRIFLQEILKNPSLCKKNVFQTCAIRCVEEKGTLRRYTPGTIYCILSHVLRHLLERQPKFSHFVKEKRLDAYLSQCPDNPGCSARVVYRNFDSELYKTETLHEWLVETTAKIKNSDREYTYLELQSARQHRSAFYICVEELQKVGAKIDFHTRPKCIQQVGVWKKAPVSGSSLCAITWVGSKKSQINDILPRITVPKGGMFVEATCGSGVLTLAMRDRRPDVKCWLNDASYPVFAFHMTLRDELPYILDRFRTELPDRATYKGYARALEAGTSSLRETGWMLFYVIHYSNMQLGVGFSEDYCCEPSFQERKFLNHSRLLQGVRITNLDFRQVWEDTNCTYFDPPYCGCTPAHYQEFQIRDLYAGLAKSAIGSCLCPVFLYNW